MEDFATLLDGALAGYHGQKREFALSLRTRISVIITEALRGPTTPQDRERTRKIPGPGLGKNLTPANPALSYVTAATALTPRLTPQALVVPVRPSGAKKENRIFLYA